MYTRASFSFFYGAKNKWEIRVTSDNQGVIAIEIFGNNDPNSTASVFLDEEQATWVASALKLVSKIDLEEVFPTEA